LGAWPKICKKKIGQKLASKSIKIYAQVSLVSEGPFEHLQLLQHFIFFAKRDSEFNFRHKKKSFFAKCRFVGHKF
jgi:hypothetical protein